MCALSDNMDIYEKHKNMVSGQLHFDCIHGQDDFSLETEKKLFEVSLKQLSVQIVFSF